MAIKVSSGPGRHPKNSSTMWLFVFCTNTNFLSPKTNEDNGLIVFVVLNVNLLWRNDKQTYLYFLCIS